MLDALMAPSRISIPRINCEITCLCTHARTARNHARADAEREREGEGYRERGKRSCWRKKKIRKGARDGRKRTVARRCNSPTLSLGISIVPLSKLLIVPHPDSNYAWLTLMFI